MKHTKKKGKGRRKPVNIAPIERTGKNALILRRRTEICRIMAHAKNSRRGNRMAATVRKYSCKNCGSVFGPSLKANFEHIKVRCSFCHHEAPLVPVPDWETPEQWEKRTGEAWPDDWAVYALERRYTVLNDVIVAFEAMSYGAAKWKGLDKIICATEAGPPPDDWKPEEER
jgi:hypothetical protein